MLFEMATGRAPFAGEHAGGGLRSAPEPAAPSPLTLNPSLPASLAAIIDKALEKDPERRYRSADELLEALKRVEPAATNAPRRRSPDERTRFSRSSCCRLPI